MYLIFNCSMVIDAEDHHHSKYGCYSNNSAGVRAQTSKRAQILEAAWHNTSHNYHTYQY